MNAVVPTVFLLCAGVVAGCSSSAGLRPDSAGYQYRGEKFGKVTVTPSAAVSNDADKTARLQELALDSKILAQMASAGLYESGSPNQVAVAIRSIRIRKAGEAGEALGNAGDRQPIP